MRVSAVVLYKTGNLHIKEMLQMQFEMYNKFKRFGTSQQTGDSIWK
jgi:hypothetical protein